MLGTIHSEARTLLNVRLPLRSSGSQLGRFASEHVQQFVRDSSNPPCSLGGCVFSLSHKPRAGSYPRRGAGVCPADGRSIRGVPFCARAARGGWLRFSARALSGRLPCATSTASRPAARGPFCSVLIERKQHGCVRAGWPMSLALLACAREGVAGALSSRAQTVLAALRNSRGTIGPQPSSRCRPPCCRTSARGWPRRVRAVGAGFLPCWLKAPAAGGPWHRGSRLGQSCSHGGDV